MVKDLILKFNLRKKKTSSNLLEKKKSKPLKYFWWLTSVEFTKIKKGN